MVGGGDAAFDDDPFPDEMDPPELLLEATVRVLSEAGLEGLTLRKVAEKSGKNRGLVHYYFESKADLLASLLDHILRGTKELIGITDDDSTVEKLWTALRFHAYGPGGIDEAGRHYYVAILQLQALAAHNPDIRRQLTRNHRFIVSLLTEIIDDGIDEGTFRPVDSESLALFLATTIDGARTTDLSTNETTARETALSMLDRWISDSVLH